MIEYRYPLSALKAFEAQTGLPIMGYVTLARNEDPKCQSTGALLALVWAGRLWTTPGLTLEDVAAELEAPGEFARHVDAAFAAFARSLKGEIEPPAELKEEEEAKKKSRRG